MILQAEVKWADVQDRLRGRSSWKCGSISTSRALGPLFGQTLHQEEPSVLLRCAADHLAGEGYFLV